jgi:RNA recognition motif-containing protein
LQWFKQQKFRDPSSAKSALQYMNGKAIREKVISVKPAESPGANHPTTPFGTPSHNLYVKVKRE